MKNTQSLLIALPMAVALFAGCQALLGIELLDDGEGADASVPPAEAGLDAGSDVAVEGAFDAADAVAEGTESGPEQCDPKCTNAALARSPCPPPADSEGPSLSEPLVFAVSNLRAGMDPKQPDDWSLLGLDLDCLATNDQGEPPSCIQEPDAGGKSKTQDGLDGRDNGFGGVIGKKVRDISTVLGKNIETVNNNGLANGIQGMLFVVENYNGKANDPVVSLSLLMSAGTVDAQGNHVAPKHDGTDIWSVESLSVDSDAGTALYRDDAAYVRDHLLVAKLPTGVPITITAEAANIVVSLTTATVHLPLSDELKYITDAVISGVWPKDQATDAMHTLVKALGACPGEPGWGVLDQSIIDAVDIRENGQADPGEPCQGISFGIGLNAMIARRGTVVDPRPPEPDPCVDDDAGLDAAAE